MDILDNELVRKRFWAKVQKLHYESFCQKCHTPCQSDYCKSLAYTCECEHPKDAPCSCGCHQSPPAPEKCECVEQHGAKVSNGQCELHDSEKAVEALILDILHQLPSGYVMSQCEKKLRELCELVRKERT